MVVLEYGAAFQQVYPWNKSDRGYFRPMLQHPTQDARLHIAVPVSSTLLSLI